MKSARTSFVVVLLLAGFLRADTVQRLPIPDAQAQATAEAAIRDLYKTELARRSAMDRAALAEKLLSTAQESANDPAGRFVLLRDAQDLAAQAGAVGTAWRAVEAATTLFSLDPLQAKLNLLGRIAPNAKTPEANNELAQAALSLCDDAIVSDKGEFATQSASIASSAAEKSHDKSLIARAKQVAFGIDRAQQDRAKIAEATKRLQDAPEDAGANTLLGTYQCLALGNWEKGLPHLLHSSDTALADLARQEIEAQANSGGFEKLADAWWQWAEKPGADAQPGQARSAYWYSRALPELTGLRKSIAAKRIAQSDGNAIPVLSWQHVVNLIPLIDAKRDTVAGAWQMNGHTLIVEDRPGFSRLRIGYLPPAEYDFRITFTRVSGKHVVMQMLSNDEHPFLWMMGGWENTTFGFGNVFGKGAGDNPTTTRVAAVLTNGQKQVSIVKVRRDSICGFLDGKLITSCRLAPSDLSADANWDVGPNALGVGNSAGRAEFQSVELIELTGRGKIPPP